MVLWFCEYSYLLSSDIWFQNPYYECWTLLYINTIHYYMYSNTLYSWQWMHQWNLGKCGSVLSYPRNTHRDWRFFFYGKCLLWPYLPLSICCDFSLVCDTSASEQECDRAKMSPWKASTPDTTAWQCDMPPYISMYILVVLRKSW